MVEKVSNPRSASTTHCADFRMRGAKYSFRSVRSTASRKYRSPDVATVWASWMSNCQVVPGSVGWASRGGWMTGPCRAFWHRQASQIGKGTPFANRVFVCLSMVFMHAMCPYVRCSVSNSVAEIRRGVRSGVRRWRSVDNAGRFDGGGDAVTGVGVSVGADDEDGS